jgi:hypothetical protein
MLGYKTILPYVSEVLSRNAENLDLATELLHLMSFEVGANSKVDYEAVQAEFAMTFTKFSEWCA